MRVRKMLANPILGMPSGPVPEGDGPAGGLGAAYGHSWHL